MEAGQHPEVTVSTRSAAPPAEQNQSNALPAAGVGCVWAKTNNRAGTLHPQARRPDTSNNGDNDGVPSHLPRPAQPAVQAGDLRRQAALKDGLDDGLSVKRTRVGGEGVGGGWGEALRARAVARQKTHGGHRRPEQTGRKSRAGGETRHTHVRVRAHAPGSRR